MLELISKIAQLDSNVQAAIISATTTVIIFGLGALGKALYDNYSLSYKLKKEYGFEQMKNIKNEIRSNKNKLLLASEELNYRLWNLKANIKEQWHNIPISDWNEIGNYYLHSFVYRWLVFNALIRETEKGIISFDNEYATKRDQLYLKYIKTMKNIFIDLLILKEFDYSGEPATNHFFKDNIDGYIAFIKDSEGNTINYNEYCQKIRNDVSPLNPIYHYVVNIEDSIDCINHNVMKEFHLILMKFLNLYGQDYQKTSLLKYIKFISDDYMRIYNKTGFFGFLKRSKMKKYFLLERLFVKKHRTIAST